MRAMSSSKTPLRDDVAYVREVVERDRFRRQIAAPCTAAQSFWRRWIATRPWMALPPRMRNFSTLGSLNENLQNRER